MREAVNGAGRAVIAAAAAFVTGVAFLTAGCGAREIGTLRGEGTITATPPQTTSAARGTEDAGSGPGTRLRQLQTGVPVPTMPPSGATAPAEGLEGVEHVAVTVLGSYPHDPGAFTQGLVLDADGWLLESTGLYGESSLREVDIETGEVIRRKDLPPDLFAEGLALVGEHLVQLTWREELALIHDRATFELIDSVRYTGEGWGLCFDGSEMVMSDGSSRLTMRDPSSFDPTGYITVTVAGAPIDRLNELECVRDRVFANVWQTDLILEIDRETGRVDRVIDASGLLTPVERASADVLNGIAYLPETDTFLITGKRWPRMFEVRFGSEAGAR